MEKSHLEVIQPLRTTPRAGPAIRHHLVSVTRHAVELLVAIASGAAAAVLLHAIFVAVSQ